MCDAISISLLYLWNTDAHWKPRTVAILMLPQDHSDFLALESYNKERQLKLKKLQIIPVSLVKQCKYLHLTLPRICF